MPDIDVVYRRAAALVALIDSAEAVPVPAERPAHALSAITAVSRSRSLLLGIVDLDKRGRADVVGVLVRALLEVWYFGVIALFGNKADLDRLEADYRYWKNDLSKSMSGISPEPEPGATFSMYKRALRADELLTEKGEQEDIAVSWYREYYAAESLTSAHAGFESLKPYVFEDADGTIGIVHTPEIAEDLRYGRVLFGNTLTTLLAQWTWERVGLNSSAFDDIGLADTV